MQINQDIPGGIVLEMRRGQMALPTPIRPLTPPAFMEQGNGWT